MDFSILNLATSGVVAQQSRVDAVGHNLANLQTPGFRAIRPELVALPADPAEFGAPSATSLTSASTASEGVAVAAISRPDVVGSAISTGAPLDVSLPPGVYLAVSYPNGTVVYTRDGHMNVGADGSLQVGMYKLAGNPKVPLGKGPVQIDQTGQILVGGKPMPGVGPLPLVVIPQPEGLQAVGDGLFGLGPTSGPPRPAQPADLKALLVGDIEGSNVQLEGQVAQLIRAQRAYGANLQMVHTWNQLSGDSIQEFGRP